MNEQQISVIADTHGLLRPEAIESLKGSTLIIHAGDIGRLEVLESLKQIAPVMAVRGNLDKETWTESLPLTEVVEIGQAWIYVIHELANLDLDTKAAGFIVVTFGYSHQPSIETRNGVIFLNPGSAGPRRFPLPVSIAIIEIMENRLRPRLVELSIEA